MKPETTEVQYNNGMAVITDSAIGGSSGRHIAPAAEFDQFMNSSTDYNFESRDFTETQRWWNALIETTTDLTMAVDLAHDMTFYTGPNVWKDVVYKHAVDRRDTNEETNTVVMCDGLVIKFDDNLKMWQVQLPATEKENN